jgi:hypothetical protein
MFNVSYITALVRLRQANIITTATLHKLRTLPPVLTAARMGYDPADSGWPIPAHSSLLDRYPLRFRSLLRDALARDAAGRSSTQEALGLTPEQIEELTGATPVPDEPDLSQEWDEYAALGALPA